MNIILIIVNTSHKHIHFISVTVHCKNHTVQGTKITSAILNRMPGIKKEQSVIIVIDI